MRLGVCYYPEHWPESLWGRDAQRMAEAGISRVRIGEFAWSRIEPAPGRFDWGWLDRAVETLHAAGLGIIMGTPTATPPKWLVDRMPDMLALDQQGRVRGFGSRRHYCFAHQGYAAEAARITQAMADRYGTHPAIVGWQTDNEYGCHDSAISYSDAARDGFRWWLAARYGEIAALNTAWGNVFWSMDYRDFGEIDLPNLTVTSANPAHWLDFRRYASDCVVRFNRAQAEILRDASPGRAIHHNFMGFFTQFDHHAVSRDLDVAGWDSYPLGFLEQFWFSDAEKLHYLRQGHPDIAGFHHDLYRGCAPTGRWCVLEQQPGPVNWARHNPAPLPGMVRLWTLEALAHGAELVSYFRWRQFPRAQEQMHAGLLRPDDAPAPGLAEVQQAAADIATLNAAGISADRARTVALIFDYESVWVTDIQPQGAGFCALRLAFALYGALRRHGLDVDIVSPAASLDGYAMAVLPCQPIVPDGLIDRLTAFSGPVLIGPRSGSKTADFAIPPQLAPGPLQRLIPILIERVESLRPGHCERGTLASGAHFAVAQWLEHAQTALAPEVALDSGQGVVWRQDRLRYLGCWPDAALADHLVAVMAAEAGLDVRPLADGVRIRRHGGLAFAFNYAPQPNAAPAPEGAAFLLGDRMMPPGGVAIWRA